MTYLTIPYRIVLASSKYKYLHSSMVYLTTIVKYPISIKKTKKNRFAGFLAPGGALDTLK